MSKRKKCLSSHTGGSTADRISNLPDPIIHHILSFLPTVDVVQTCVLSKRWVTLSCSAPSIDLDIDLFTDRKKLHRKKRHAQVRFVEFVDNVLLFHDKSDIHKFRLKLNYDTDTNRDYGWITLVIRKNVQVLDIEIPKRIKQPFELPPSLFRCESLRVLKLRLHSSNLRLPSSLCLSGLRKLVLESVKFYDDQSVESIITSCPVLETLVLLYSGVPSKKNLTISSHQLKNLTVIGYGYIPGGKFKIIAPALTKLKLAFTIPDICVFEEPYSLFDVIIELYERQFSGKVIQFLGGFCNAKSLSLSAQFNEVACLKLIIYPGSFGAVRSLLKYCPNVEALVLHFCSNEDIPLSIEMGILQLDHLTTVEFLCFRDYSDQVELVKSLLKSSVTLEKMIFIDPYANKI